VINTVSDSPNVSGLKYDIHSSEARERDYPYLEAFLELLEKLLQKGGIPEELGIQHRYLQHYPGCS
jgi:hypothetical protein